MPRNEDSIIPESKPDRFLKPSRLAQKFRKLLNPHSQAKAWIPSHEVGVQTLVCIYAKLKLGFHHITRIFSPDLDVHSPLL